MAVALFLLVTLLCSCVYFMGVQWGIIVAVVETIILYKALVGDIGLLHTLISCSAVAAGGLALAAISRVQD